MPRGRRSRLGGLGHRGGEGRVDRGQPDPNSAGQLLTYNDRDQTTSVRPSLTAGPVAMGHDGPTWDERVSAGALNYQYGLVGLEIVGAGLLVLDTYFTFDNQGNLVGERTGGSNYYYLFDGLGSVVRTHGPSGQRGQSVRVRALRRPDPRRHLW